MKRLLILIFIITVASTSSAQSDTKDHWKIDKTIALDMIKCFTECTGERYDDSKVTNHRPNVLTKILKDYPPENVIWVPARYREEDEIRYKQKRGYSNSSKSGKVRGHNTLILQATSMDRSTTDYFDLVTIQPPPYD